MIQDLEKIYGYQDKKTKLFTPFSDNCILILHRDGSCSIRIPKDE